MQVQPSIDMMPSVPDQHPAAAAAAAAAPSSTAHEPASSARHDNSSGAGPSGAPPAVDSSQAGPSNWAHHSGWDESTVAGPSHVRCVLEESLCLLWRPTSSIFPCAGCTCSYCLHLLSFCADVHNENCSGFLWCECMCHSTLHDKS